MMDLATIQRIRSSPAEFRKRLLLDKADGGVATLDECSDPWQREDDAALDNGLCRAAGIPTDTTKPTHSRAYLERARGHAKSSTLAAAMSWLLYSSPRQIEAIGAAADQEQGGILRNAVARLVGLNPWLGDALDVQQWRVVNVRTQSELRIISSDVGSSYGLTPHVVVCDELSHWGKPDLWASLVSSAAKRKDCFLAVISNAGLSAGGTSWGWEAREAARLDARWYFRSLPGCCASWIDADTLAEQKRLLPHAAYLRLWENVWCESTGDALSPSDVRGAVALPGPMAPDADDAIHVGGIDLSTRRDRSAIVIVSADFRRKRVRLAEVRTWAPNADGIDLQEVRDTAIELANKWGCAYAVDPYQAALLCRDLNDKNIRTVDFHFAGKNLNTLAEVTLQSFRENRVDLFECDELITDLLKLNIEQSRFGFKLSAPRDGTGHADAAFAFCLALVPAMELAQTYQPDDYWEVASPMFGREY